MGSFGGWEIILVLVVILLLFGAARLPKLARSVGQASKEFKKGVSEGYQGEDDEDEPQPSKKKAEKEAD